MGDREGTYHELLRAAKFWDALMYAVQELLPLDYDREIFEALEKIIELQY